MEKNIIELIITTQQITVTRKQPSKMENVHHSTDNYNITNISDMNKTSQSEEECHAADNYKITNNSDMNTIIINEKGSH